MGNQEESQTDEKRKIYKEEKQLAIRATDVSVTKRIYHPGGYACFQQGRL